MPRLRSGHRRHRLATAFGAVVAAAATVLTLSSAGSATAAEAAPAAASTTAAARGATAAAGHNPVVFVHGYTGSASNWVAAMARFRLAGYSSAELSAYEYDWQKSNVTSAQGLATHVDNVLRQTGAEKVDIVNHSMGGLVSQYYLKNLGGAAKVGHLASLAGANHGTTSAAACTIYASCREMVPGSSYIRDISSGDETPGPTEYGTWYSACDGIILPYTSTRLDGADNNNAGCVTHIGFLTDVSVASDVLDFFGS